MRTVIPLFVLGLTLAASAEASPLSPKPPAIEFGAAPPIELARDGCGRGWHRTRWRDQWGYSHWGHCIPNGGPRDAWGAGWDRPYSDWHAVQGRWGSDYQ